MRKLILIHFVILSFSGFGSDNGYDIFKKVITKHSNLSGVLIKASAKVFSDTKNFIEVKSLCYKEESIHYMEIDGIRYFTSMRDKLNIQVLDRNKTIVLSEYRSITNENKELQTIANDELLKNKLKLSFTVAVNTKNRIQINITSSKYWDYDVISLLIDPSTYLIQQIIYVPNKKANLGYYKTVIDHQYATQPPPKFIFYDSIVYKKKGDWFVTDSYSGYQLVNYLKK